MKAFGKTQNKPVRSQAITPELQHWLSEHLRVGTPPQQIVEGMVGAGWETAVAWRALSNAQAAFAAAAAATAATAASAAVAASSASAASVISQTVAGAAKSASTPSNLALPEPNIAEGANQLVIDGHTVRIALAVKHPRVVVFEGLLTPEECTGLMAQSASRLARSETVDNLSGGSEVNAARTSEGMFFGRGESELITRIEDRIAKLVRWPVNHGEGLQILRYRPGSEYKPHYDYFDPVHPGSAPVLARGGQRVGTLVMYLSAPVRGGGTTFPDIGLEVAPIPGSAVFFSYDRPDPGTRTLHGGAPVLEGEKWVATKWLREGEFR